MAIASFIIMYLFGLSGTLLCIHQREIFQHLQPNICMHHRCNTIFGFFIQKEDYAFHNFKLDPLILIGTYFRFNKYDMNQITLFNNNNNLAFLRRLKCSDLLFDINHSIFTFSFLKQFLRIQQQIPRRSCHHFNIHFFLSRKRFK